MSKRFTESEVTAMIRNKKEEKALKVRLQKLTEEKGEYADNSLKEIKHLVTLCKDNRRTSGYSPLPDAGMFVGEVRVPSLQDMRRFTKPWAMTPQYTTFNVNYQNTSPVPSPPSSWRLNSGRRSNTTLSRLSTRNSTRTQESIEPENRSALESATKENSRIDKEDPMSARKKNSINMDYSFVDETSMNENEDATPKTWKNSKESLTSKPLVDKAATCEEVSRNKDNYNVNSDYSLERESDVGVILDGGENNQSEDIDSDDLRKRIIVMPSISSITMRSSEEKLLSKLSLRTQNTPAKVKFRIEKQSKVHFQNDSRVSEENNRNIRIQNIQNTLEEKHNEENKSLQHERNLYNNSAENQISSRSERGSREISTLSTSSLSAISESELQEALAHDSKQTSLPGSFKEVTDDKINQHQSTPKQSMTSRPLTSQSVEHQCAVPEVSDGQVRPHTVTGMEMYADRELDFSISDNEDSNFIVFKGRKLHNYIKPQHRYKVDPFQFKRKERLIRKLATETEIFMQDQRKKLYKVEITFSKATRQRLLKQLVEDNSSRESKSKLDARDDKLDFKIKSFLKSIDNFCNGTVS